MGRTIHNGSATPEYLIWRNIRDRCSNPNYKPFAFYGARGITVCERWRKSFAAFIEDMGWRPDPSLTVDRVDNDKGYEPGNCRWATRKKRKREIDDSVRMTRFLSTARGFKTRRSGLAFHIRRPMRA